MYMYHLSINYMELLLEMPGVIKMQIMKCLMKKETGN